ncbi:LPS-assembly lipoprotein LptE precursor [Pigmentiphaga humi]|uniref:LPS-assembly lipoprotein LptE n=1 Tax=Pigmentiphaga humi TaxID=2478468 RepID=A0A3P4BAH2_9BURK|nr:LPS assembly lipoprotein LptE [Pigmentiphaga humi]VCU72536.1 LPS-assembly lipoprotein LptE precursor [Pigmentiphaga humi]
MKPWSFSDMADARRRFLRAAAGAGGLALLTGCGFALRGTANLPFSTLYIGASDTSEMGAQLRRYVRNTTNTQVVEDPRQAQAQLQILSETRERSILTLDAAGRVREYELRYLLSFRVQGNGREYIPDTTIALKRDITFADANTLAKDSEANLLYRDMQNEAVQQVLRRMAAI